MKRAADEGYWRWLVMTKQYLSETMAAIHETAEGLHAIGLLDTQTMRQFDDACVTPVHPLFQVWRRDGSPV